MLSVDKPTSLVEAKKRQWAREREEMSRFYVPWDSENTRIRNQFSSTLELHKQSSYEYQEPRQRSPSLPPIRSSADDVRRRDFLNRNLLGDKSYACYDEDGEGDTSGYASETVNLSRRRQSQEIVGMTDRHHSVAAWQTGISENRSKNDGSYRSTPPEHKWSLSSRHGGGGEEGRLKWGDRGVATGRLWEPQEPSARLPQMQIQKKGTPSWVERGLNMIESTADVLVIDQQSNHSGGVEYDRSSYNGSDVGRNTFLRGQNVPIEPEVKAVRESRRIKALEVQNAIMNQLEEREVRKREEKERKLKEEHLEELRIQRQQEEDQKRFSDEKRKHQEKLEIEQRKMEALKKAIEDAEKQAKLDKEKHFLTYKSINRNLDDPQKANIQTIENNDNTATTDENNISNKLLISKNSPRKIEQDHTYVYNSNYSGKAEMTGENNNVDESKSTATGNVNLCLHGMSCTPLTDAHVGILPINITPDLISPMVNVNNALQLAVILPNSNNGIYNLSQPLSFQSLNSFVNIDDITPTGKLLTPRKYRNLRSRDVATQTDPTSQNKAPTTTTDNLEKSTHKNDKNYQHIDENAPQESHITKKERRFRSEERFKKEIDNRPKWGVNRPAAQYKKQSEKDPFYTQKRKLRQKYRSQPRQYTSHSSDDSRSPSPTTELETLTESKSRMSLSQSHWRTKRSSQEIFRPSSVSVETVNITQLEYNHLGQLTMNDRVSDDRCCLSSNVSPSKRFTLSQKFINDKYGNRKLWNEDALPEKNKQFNIIDINHYGRKKTAETAVIHSGKKMTETKQDYAIYHDNI